MRLRQITNHNCCHLRNINDLPKLSYLPPSKKKEAVKTQYPPTLPHVKILARPLGHACFCAAPSLSIWKQNDFSMHREKDCVISGAHKPAFLWVCEIITVKFPLPQSSLESSSKSTSSSSQKFDFLTYAYLLLVQAQYSTAAHNNEL